VYIETHADELIRKHEVWLPDYGEVKIITHAGQITLIETTTKEKIN
jgi:hypothetical protein